ncbi:MAG: HAMP domain-containing sensor histidine kinase [Anaerolineales bacterium]
MFIALRKRFVFDNLAIYRVDGDAGHGLPEVVYARAVGRGKSREADASWGENIANQVIASGRMMVLNPESPSEDRIAMPYLLGLPLDFLDGKGALVFIRFGGPPYLDEHLPFAALGAALGAHILERRRLREQVVLLEQARYRAQLQDDFIATISHDLHTPLGFIKGYATSLLRSDTTWDAATQREFLTIIDEETDHLIALIDRLLDSSRLQTGMLAMDFQPVILDKLLRDVAQRVSGRCPGLNVILELENLPAIQADNVRLGQVFENLLDNAVKYAPGSPVTIRAWRRGQAVTLTLADRGPGIPAEHLPYVFERFYRVPGQSGQRGAGLGLFICRQIVQAHHGQITVETVPGKGTTFRIELPVRQEGKGKQP